MNSNDLVSYQIFRLKIEIEQIFFRFFLFQEKLDQRSRQVYGADINVYNLS